MNPRLLFLAGLLFLLLACNLPAAAPILALPSRWGRTRRNHLNFHALRGESFILQGRAAQIKSVSLCGIRGIRVQSASYGSAWYNFSPSEKKRVFQEKNDR